MQADDATFCKIFLPSGQAETIVTADEGVRGGKTIPLKAIVDEALQGCDCVKRVLVASRTGADVPMVPDRDIKLEEVRNAHCSLSLEVSHTSLSFPCQAMAGESNECSPEPMGSEDPLFMLYTSGSTGKPKGIIHTQAGYILFAGLTHQVGAAAPLACHILRYYFPPPPSMSLTIVLEMCGRVLPILDGSPDTPTLCMALLATGARRCFSRARPSTPTQVRTGGKGDGHGI